MHRLGSCAFRNTASIMVLLLLALPLFTSSATWTLLSQHKSLRYFLACKMQESCLFQKFILFPSSSGLSLLSPNSDKNLCCLIKKKKKVYFLIHSLFPSAGDLMSCPLSDLVQFCIFLFFKQHHQDSCLGLLIVPHLMYISYLFNLLLPRSRLAQS